MTGRGMRARTLFVVALVGAMAIGAGAPRTLAAQQKPAPNAEAKVRAQRDELERIRRERSNLEEKMSQLQGTVHDLA